MAKRNIFKNRGKTYIFSNKGGGGESGVTVTPLTVTENGTYTSAAGQAYSPVTVRVEGDVEVEDNKPVSISENGTVVINPTSGKDAMAKVTATVNVTPVLETKTITENGTYTPSSGKDGFGEVTVNVSGGEGGVVTLYAFEGGEGVVFLTTLEAGVTTLYESTQSGLNVWGDYEYNGSDIIEFQSHDYFRTPARDRTFATGEGGALYCWKGAGGYTFYTASATPADEALIYTNIGESGQPSEINRDWFRVKHYSNGAITVQEKNTQLDEWEDYTSPAEETEFSRYNEGDIVLSADIEENKAATIDVSQYSTPVEITPTSGKDGMAKTTVMLTNIPSGTVTAYCWKVEGVGFEFSEYRYFNFSEAPADRTEINTKKAARLYKDSSAGNIQFMAIETCGFDTYTKVSSTSFTGEADGDELSFTRVAGKDFTLWS